MSEDLKEKKPLSIYCNSIQIASSPYDFAISLNLNKPSETEALVEVVMSPEHAKVFSQMLVHNVREYEQTFGVIPDVSPQAMDELVKKGKIIIESVKN